MKKPFVVLLIQDADGTVYLGTAAIEPGSRVVGLRIPIPIHAKIIHAGLSSPYREELTIPDGTRI